MNATAIEFCGEELLLDPAGVMIWPRLSLLAVADLHLEKGSACAARGQLVPPWDSGLTLQRLATVVDGYKPQIVLALGDSFHDAAGAGRLSATDRSVLTEIATAARLVWIQGNHDPSPPASLPGEFVQSWTTGGLVFRHRAEAEARGEISGHFHPKARVATRAGDIVRPCFIGDGERFMLPAFGAYTGGLDISRPAIASLFPNGGQVFVLGRDRLFGFGLGSEPQPLKLARS